MSSDCSTRFVFAAVFAVLSAFSPALRAAEASDYYGRPQYYLCNTDAAGKTSMTSGGNSAAGWTTYLGGAKTVDGVKDSTAVYHVPGAYLLRTATSGDQTFGGATKAEVKAQKDLAGMSRLFGGQVDMGCFESRVAATMILLR